MKHQTLIFTQLVLLLALFCPFSFGQDVTRITGRVVDKNGKPIMGAKVTLEYPPCEECHDWIVPGDISSEDGFFSIVSKGVFPQSSFLFIEGPNPCDCWNPLSPASVKLAQLEGFKERVIDIPFGISNSSNLGDIEPTISLFPVVLDVNKLFQREASTSKNDAEYSLKIYFRDKSITEEMAVERRDIHNNGNDIKLLLPQGSWTLELSRKSGNRTLTTKLDVLVRDDGTTDIR